MVNLNLDNVFKYTLFLDLPGLWVSQCVMGKDVLKVYSEDNMLYGEDIQKYTASDAEQIKDKILKEGNKATKGFFYAILPMDSKSMKDKINVVEGKINTEKIQNIGKRCFALLSCLDKYSFILQEDLPLANHLLRRQLHWQNFVSPIKQDLML